MKTALKSVLVTAAIILTGCSRTITFEAGELILETTRGGKIESMRTRSGNTEYIAAGIESSLLTIRADSVYYRPTRITMRGDTIELFFSQPGVSAEILVKSHPSYLALELTGLSGDIKPDLAIWGPFRTTIGRTIGETIGVVRDSLFAIGIQALNPKTLGGYPVNEDDNFDGFDIFATASLVDVADSVKIFYRSNTAKPESYGSSFSAYTRSREAGRVVSAMGHDRYTSPAYNDNGLTGSRIALFGCKPGKVLDVIEEIEIREGLPHPMLNGEWAKRSGSATAAYLILDFTPENYRDAINLTKRAGLKYLYHGEPFRTWGHFNLRYNMTWDDLAGIVGEAEAEGIKVGVHTLSNFITPNDPYVTPVPDKRLARVGSSTLAKEIGPGNENITISDPDFFNQMKNNSLRTFMIGKELVIYDSVSSGEPWVLWGCKRGSFGTEAAAHSAGDTISKLADHAYNVFLTDIGLSLEVAGRIADLFNRTGLRQISFDGLEGNCSTGMGKYGELLFVKEWYDRLSPEIKNDFIMDASRSGHYFWHMFTRMNWGEPWYAGFRESQTEYRLLNQDYFRRNYIPCMLGWFSMRKSTSIEDIEWMLARSAAFDAGYALVSSISNFSENGNGEKILEKIRIWEKARMNRAFSSEQKKRMENIKNEFSLVSSGESRYELIQYEVRRFEHAFHELQPGQPVSSSFRFNNPYRKQVPGFILTVKDGPVSDITLSIGNDQKIDLPVRINPGESLRYTGGNSAVLFSANWNTLRKVGIDSSAIMIPEGEHEITVVCKFPEHNKGILKIEFKTAGDPEIIDITKK